MLQIFTRVQSSAVARYTGSTSLTNSTCTGVLATDGARSTRWMDEHSPPSCTSCIGTATTGARSRRSNTRTASPSWESLLNWVNTLLLTLIVELSTYKKASLVLLTCVCVFRKCKHRIRPGVTIALEDQICKRDAYRSSACPLRQASDTAHYAM